MQLSLSFALATAASLCVADARIANPLGDAMNILVNDEHFLQGHHLYRLMKQDGSDDDAACEAETEAIYTDKEFSRTLFMINLQCPADIEMTEDSFSMTMDYTDCDEEDKFEDACTGLSGSVLMVPDITASCSLEYEGSTYTSSLSMVGGGVCAGESCSLEYDEAEVEETADELAAEMEGQIAGILAIFNMTGTPDCDVDVGSPDASGMAIQ